MEYAEEIRKAIEEENRRAIDESTWGKPASDIITRIESMESAIPSRAIWEMVQNARDVSQREGADIIFRLGPNEFRFEHDGLPFTPKTLHSLNIQTSSKVRDDIIQVGQYGTGFLTTHKFGLKFELSGALYIKECGKYLDFCGLRFDRSPRNKEEMIENLKAQQAIIANLATSEDSIKRLRDHTEAHTVFSYKQEHAIERERAEEAFLAAPDMTPHVLALNELINSITYTDETSGRTSRFERRDKQILERNELYTFSMVETGIHRNYDEKGVPTCDYDYQIYMLESSEKTEGVGSKVTVILPLLKENVGGTERIRVFRFRPNKSNFFIYLPLLGSERWGVNFLFHSPLFSCADESRSSLRFIGNGQNNDYQAEQNREIVALGEKMIFSFIESYINEFTDRKMFSFVNLDINVGDAKLASYYKEKQNFWVEKMSRFPLALSASDDSSYVSPASFKGISEEMTKEGYDNPAFLDAVFSLLSTNHKDSLPAKKELLFWSDRFREWYGEENAEHFYGINDIINVIKSKSNVSELGRESILEFDRFLSKKQYFTHFENYPIIPNEAGILKRKGELTCPSDFNATTRSVISVLIAEDYEKFVDAGFASLTQFTAFTNDELRTKLSDAITKLQSDQKGHRDRFKRYFLRHNNSDFERNPEQYTLPTDKVQALIRFASMIIKPDSQSAESKLLHLAIEHVGLAEEICDTIDGFDAGSACRTLIQNVLYDFATADQTRKDTCADLVRRVVDTVFGFADFNALLREYPVYKDQKGNYKYAEQLKRGNGIPDRLKEIYDSIVLEGKNESILDTLVAKDYSDVFIDQAECLGTDLAAKVFEKISARRAGETKSYPDISVYAHRSEVLEIIRRMDDTEEGRCWASLFSALEKDKATVTMSIIDDGDKKSSIFKIMQEGDAEKLKAIANITEKIKDKESLKIISDLADAKDIAIILSTAKRLNEERLETERQFNFKYTIGKFIEDELRKAVSDELSCSFATKDVQDGQDMVITYKERPVYYLESKAKWNFSEPAHMSSQQMKQAVRESGHYALCCVDCTADTGARISMDASMEEVMASHDEIVNHTYVHTDIGELLRPTVGPIVTEEDTTQISDDADIRVRGDLRSYIPKKVFIRGMRFRDFIPYLSNYLQGILANNI